MAGQVGRVETQEYSHSFVERLLVNGRIERTVIRRDESIKMYLRQVYSRWMEQTLDTV
jgi:hypothetical protein